MMGYRGGGANRTVTGISVLIVIFIVLGISGVNSAPVNSTLDFFNVTNTSLSAIYINWSNSFKANITLGKSPNVNYINISIVNSTTGISGNYSQRDAFLPAAYPRYWARCFYQGDATRDSPLMIVNKTGDYSNTTHLGFTSQNDSNVTLVYNVTCPPGRYWGIVNITNTTNASDTSDYYDDLVVQIDIPISSENELNSTTGVGSFGGFMPANAGTYHYYYFNTSNATNATAVKINLTWTDMNKDLDLFLFNAAGTMMAKSVNNDINESIYYAHIPLDEVWEIRVYGNITVQEEYAGSIYLSKLNASKDYDADSQAGMLDFGIMNASQRIEKNITLSNRGDLELTGVRQYIEFYHIQTFDSNQASESENHTFIVPSTANRLRVSINWSGASDYNLTLYNPSGSVAGTSTNKSFNANMTDAEQEEFVEVNSSNMVGGTWTLNVVNDTAVGLDAFNAIVKFWETGSDWVETNYTTMAINRTGQQNSSRSIHINLTVQNMTTSGLYLGSIQYLADSGTGFRVPFKVNVTAPVLMANNTFETINTILEDNYGFNKTRSFNVSIQNNGNVNLASMTVTNSSDYLRRGSSRINFTFQAPTGIDIGESKLLNVTLDINTIDTSDATGIYAGWIYLANNDSRPYQGLNVSIRFNMSSLLRLVVSSVTGPTGLNEINTSNQTRNLTIVLKAYYLNGTEITGIPNIGNFTVRLEETNVSGYRINRISNLTLTKGAPTMYYSGSFRLNASVPANNPGGRYWVNVSATRRVNNRAFYGSTSYSSVGITRPGLYITLSRSSLTINEGKTATTYLNLSATNYGTVKAVGSIGLDFTEDRDDCVHITFGRPDDDYDDYDQNGGSPDFDLAEWSDIQINGNGSLAWYRWKFTAANVSQDKVCTLKVNSSDPLLNNKTFTITINSISSSDGNGDNSGGDTGDDDDSSSDTVYNYSVEITNYPDTFIEYLGGTNTTNITVKNTGNMSTEVKVSVSINDGISASVSPEDYYIPWGKSRNFTISFNVSNSSTLGEHSGTIKAYVSLNTDKYDTKSFTFNVLSTAEREKEINDSYNNYSIIFNELFNNFTGIKATGMLSEENLTEVEIIINDTLQSLNDIKDAITAGDYAAAESLLADMNSNINRVKAGIESLFSEKQKAEDIAMGGLWVWVVVGVIIAAVAGLFVYMMLPTEGGGFSLFGAKSKPGYTGFSGRSRSIKEFFRKLFRRNKKPNVKEPVKKSKKYSGGYQKQKPVGYEYKK